MTYQPRTTERLVEILRAQDANPRSWQAEAAEALSRLSGERDEAVKRIAELKQEKKGGFAFWRATAKRFADARKAALARAETAERQRDEAIERAAKDTGLLDFIEKHPSLEISYSWEDDDGPWEVHRVTGGRNDREWTKVGHGETLREAIASAIRALKPGT